MSAVEITIEGDPSFLRPPEEKPREELSVEICENILGIMSDPSNLLYESIIFGQPEQIVKYNLFNKIGDRKTMPYPPKN